MNPRDLKMRLAHELVRQLHGAGRGEEAEAEFVRIFQRRELPTEMPDLILAAAENLVDLIARTAMAPSKAKGAPADPAGRRHTGRRNDQEHRHEGRSRRAGRPQSGQATLLAPAAAGVARQ